MPDTPFIIVERARRRTAQVRLGNVSTSLQDGPKWVCQIVPSNETQSDVGAISSTRMAATFGSLKPANVSLTNCVEHEGGWLASSARDEAGRCRAYAHLGVDRTLEMVGMPGVGPWLDERDTWWPGAYELPLLEQLPAIVAPLLGLGDKTGSAYLLMSLTAIDGTALVTESDNGIERPFRIPGGVDTVHFSPVCIGGPMVRWRGALIAAFDRIRHLVGLKSTRPFYL
ncbi:hypothetical protein ACFSHT_16250 [Paraburkholderia silviterrae]|uniref:Uncharacterized protein n=1 Tax=Paraburkholderia silviterrae TaxID=2528715 RepID=A0A4R5M966_9BURK|nr:hypothetical protein [Paraburkholderia silviterrae]TDG23162.1 hypothetical protein EYW47_14570 [Paraburkholderia silviterrae]